MRRILLAAVLAALPVLPGAAAAGDLEVSLTTLFRAYDYVDLDGDTVRLRTLAPSLQAAASDLLGGDLSFRAQARRIESFEEPGSDENDLLYAVLEWRDPKGRVGVSAGRQVLARGPGYTRFDGLRAALRSRGLELGAALGFGFERDGRRREKGLYTGANLELRLHGDVTLGLAVERGTEDGVEHLFKQSADLRWNVSRALSLGGSFIHNAAVGEMDELLGTIRWRLGRNRFEVELGRIHPHFDPDSIWNVFNSGPYDRLAVRATHDLDGERELWVRGERRSYWNERGANIGRATPAERDRNDSLALGFGSRPAASPGYAMELFLHDGFGGFRAGGSVRIGTEMAVLPGRIEAGVDLRAYDRGARDSRQDLTTAYWAEALLRFGRHARLRLRAEDYRNGFLLDTFRVTIKLDLASQEAWR